METLTEIADEAACPLCGTAIAKREEALPLEEAEERRMSLRQLVILPLGIITGLFVGLFPLSLIVVYLIAALLM